MAGVSERSRQPDITGANRRRRFMSSSWAEQKGLASTRSDPRYSHFWSRVQAPQNQRYRNRFGGLQLHSSVLKYQQVESGLSSEISSSFAGFEYLPPALGK